MFDLSGKAALVTGASGGIGAAIARTLCENGGIVGLSGTRVEPLEALADELGETAFVLPCNLSDAEDVAELPKRAVAATGTVDILVNNAGITRDNLFMRMSDEEWASVLQVNLTSAMMLSKGVIRGNDEVALGADCEYFVGCWCDGQSRTDKLCRVKSRIGRAFEVIGL